MKTLCGKVVVLGPQNQVLLTIFIYIKKRRLQSNFREACIELKKILKFFLVPFLATKETLVPLANDPIMQKRLIWSFRHLECRNPSIISEDIGRARMVQQFQNGTEEQNGGTEERNRRTEYSCLNTPFDPYYYPNPTTKT